MATDFSDPKYWADGSGEELELSPMPVTPGAPARRAPEPAENPEPQEPEPAPEEKPGPLGIPDRGIAAAPDVFGGTDFSDPKYHGEALAPAEPVPEAPVEEPGFLGRSWDLLKKSYWKSSSASATMKAKSEAEEYLEFVEGDGQYNPPSISAFGMPTVEDMRLQSDVMGGKSGAREAVAQKLYNDVDASIKRAQELSGKEQSVGFSPVVKEFLENEDESTSVVDDMFADGVGGFASIVWELGLSSGYGSAKSMAAGTVAGLATGGNPAAFAAGMGAASAREEFAFRVAQKMQEAGLDPTDTDAFIRMVADDELMSTITTEAGIEAAVVGSVDAATGGLATKTFGKEMTSIFGREAVNLVAQTAIQGTGGAAGEWLAEGISKGDWEFGREEVAEALGELVTAPLDVAGAAVSGAKETKAQKPDQKRDELMELLVESQRKAEEEAAAQGGDELDQALAGQEAVAEASNFAGDVLAELNAQEELDRQAVEEPQVEPAEPASELTDQEVAAEVQTELEREQIQTEAAGRYTEGARRGLQEERAYALRQREKAAEKRKQEAEAIGQREAQRAEEPATARLDEETAPAVTPEPAKATLGEALRTAQQKAKAKKAKNLTGRRVLEDAKNQPPLLEDQRPSAIVVDPEGAARPMTAAELDSQVRRRWDALEQLNLDLPGGKVKGKEIPVRVQGLDLLIENPKGSTRTGTREDGTEWSRTFKDAHYGKIKGVRGADNEGLDVYIGEQDWRPKGQKVWVVNQYNQDGSFDEHKVMLGFGNQTEAEQTYDNNTQGMVRGEVVEMSIEEFKSWAFDGARKNRPLASPEVLQVATQEDLEIMAERTKPGRKKPQVVYKKGGAAISVERGIQEDIQLEGADSRATTGPITRISVNENGKELGAITIRRRGDRMQITSTGVIEEAQQRGLGQQLIREAIREANSQGFELISDTQVSVAQLRAYEAARKKGDIVVEYSDPAAVQEKLEEYAGIPTKDLISSIDNLNLGSDPVVSRTFLPEFVEDIQFRRESEIDTEGGFTNQEAREVIKLLQDFMPGINPDQMLIVDDVQDLPMEYFAELSRKNRDGSDNLGAFGFYDRANDVIAVILNNHPNRAQAIKTFMHESVGHYGMIKLFGKDLYPLMEDIWENGDRAAIAAIADRYGLDISSLPERLQAVEEYVAHLAESGSNPTLLQRIVNFVRQILRNAGILDSWTDSDIQLLLRDVRRELRSKPLDKITISSEAEIEETGETVTLEQPADVALRQHDKRVNMLERLRDCVR